MWRLGESGLRSGNRIHKWEDTIPGKTRYHGFSTRYASNEKNCCSLAPQDDFPIIASILPEAAIKNVHFYRAPVLRHRNHRGCWLFSTMQDMKDTRRALVRIGFDGRVHKTFRGHQARERFENEVRVLRYLESKGCQYVPKVLETFPEELRMVTTSCGQRVEHITEEKVRGIFSDLERKYHVRHEDAYARNITYSPHAGHFCVIDFEFATILDPAAPPGPRLDLPQPDGPRGD